MAPTVFRDSQSSFGLWAVLANYGTVHATPLMDILQLKCVSSTPDMGWDWVWSRAPVMYPHVAFQMNITIKVGMDSIPCTGICNILVWFLHLTITCSGLWPTLYLTNFAQDWSKERDDAVRTAGYASITDEAYDKVLDWLEAN